MKTWHLTTLDWVLLAFGVGVVAAFVGGALVNWERVRGLLQYAVAVVVGLLLYVLGRTQSHEDETQHDHDKPPVEQTPRKNSSRRRASDVDRARDDDELPADFEGGADGRIERLERLQGGD